MSWNKYLGESVPLFITSLKVNLVICVLDLLFSLVIIIWKEMDAIDLIGLIDNLLFLEGGLFLLAGGASEATSTASFHKIRESIFSTTEKWSPSTYEKGRQKALQYISVGFLLIIESIQVATLM